MTDSRLVTITRALVRSYDGPARAAQAASVDEGDVRGILNDSLCPSDDTTTKLVEAVSRLRLHRDPWSWDEEGPARPPTDWERKRAEFYQSQGNAHPGGRNGDCPRFRRLAPPNYLSPSRRAAQ